MRLRWFVFVAGVLCTSVVQAQYRSSSAGLSRPPVEDEATVVGIHKSRLDFAMSYCGGSHHEKRIHFYGSGRRQNPGLFITTYNDETTRISIYARVNGLTATCRELLSH